MKNTLCTFFILMSFAAAYSQTGYRIQLIKNLNPYPAADYSALWGYTSPEGREYAILGCHNGTSFIDITDTNDIREVDFLPLPPGVAGSTWREMKTYSHYCYIVSESQGSKIQIVDMQNLPDSIRYIGLSSIPLHSRTHTISQSGSYLYLNGGNNDFCDGIAVLDLSSNPEIPVLRGKWTDMYVHDSRIINDTIWACNIVDGKISIIDARNKDSLKTIRSWVNNPAPNFPHNIALSGNRNYAFVTDETFPPAGRMKIWDVSDLDNITYITSFNPHPFDDAVVHNVEVYGNYAFLAYYVAGVKVLDISNPASPVEVGWYDTYPESNTGFGGCWGIYYFATGKIIASDMTRGLFVLRPKLNSSVPGFPEPNFMPESNSIPRFTTQKLLDLSEGVPNTWNWTITGNQNETSTLENPTIQFNHTGVYDVKLRVSNSFGTDSIFKTAVFTVSNSPIPAFHLTNPSAALRITTSPTDTSKVLFDWERPVNSPEMSYKIYFRKLASAPEEYLLSGNNGRDSSLSVTRSYLDSLASRLGTTADSVRVQCKVRSYIGTDSGTTVNNIILTITRGTVGIYTMNGNIPLEYKLYNNYPNPFNPETNIKFDIPKAGKISLTLYDISGKEVIKLLNENLDAGSYGFKLNASDLSSGIYFLRMTLRDYSSGIRIMLIK